MTHLSHPKYRKDIDGLRAIAVLTVVGFHAYPGLVRGGFIGVDIFFVISGYLISTIIFDNLENGNFSFTEFYARRVKRIFPALLLVITVCFIFGWFVLFSDEDKQLGKHIAAGAGFVSNLVLWNESGYFDKSAETKPLLHLWSLGIEEQYYIIWPLLVWFAWKRKLGLLKITFVVLTVSFALNIYGIHKDAVATFYSPQTRFWELMSGSLLAWYVLHRKKNIKTLTIAQSNVLSLFGISFLVLGFLITTIESVFPGWIALLPVLGSVLIILAGTQAWVNRTLLSNRIAVWFGLISYPLYLWHWPLLSFAVIISGGKPSVYSRTMLVVLSIILAWLTYKLIEQPIQRVESKRKTVALVSLMITIGCIGYISFGLRLIPDTPLSRTLNPELFKAKEDWSYPGKLIKSTISGVDVYRNIDEPPEVLFIGDSHIEQFGPRIADLIKNVKVKPSAIISRDACPAIPNIFSDDAEQCKGMLSDAMKVLEDNKEIKTVVIGGCWNCYFLGQSIIKSKVGVNRYYYKKDNVKEFLLNKNGKEYAFIELKRFLQMLSKNHKVFLILDNPSGEEFSPLGSFSDKNRLELYMKNNLSISSYVELDKKFFDLDKQLKDIAVSAGAKTISQLDTMCIDKKCLKLDTDNKPIYKDATHLRPYYVTEKANYFDAVFTD
jgi:peptidoglycan/LPS O-acetylase OafA/YrhL